MVFGTWEHKAGVVARKNNKYEKNELEYVVLRADNRSSANARVSCLLLNTDGEVEAGTPLCSFGYWSLSPTTKTIAEDRLNELLKEYGISQ